MSVKEREEISEEYKWNVEKVYSSTEQWEKDFERAKELAEGLKKYQGQLTDSPEKFSEFMDKYSEAKTLVSQLSSYARMRRDEDTRKEEYQALAARASSLSSKISSDTSFVEVEIQEASDEKYRKLAESEETQEYSHFLEKIRDKKDHTRSEEIEQILSNLGEVLSSPSDIYSTFTNADLEFPSIEKDGEKVEITQSNFTKLLKESDRGLREEVFNKFYDRFNDFDNTVAQSLDKEARTNSKFAEIRDYNSSLESALDGKNVPEQVFNDLIESVNSNFDPLHRHQELKRKVLGVDELKMWDVYMPMADSDIEITYEEAKEHILNALEPMGEEYVEAARKGLESGWVDVYENKGKRSGAYSGGGYGTDPYILMNFHEDVQSMYTLAHELGHSMHSYFTESEQPYIYSNYGIFLAEIASTVNEQLLTEYLLKQTDNEELKKHALDYQLENFRNTLFRQTMFAEFEKEIHEAVEDGEVLTSGMLNEKYRNLKEKYYENADVDDRIAREWMRIPHFYYNFYVYQYATGISAATNIREKLVEDGRNQDYLEFLKSGGSNYPLETLQIMDIEADRHTFDEAIQEYRRYLKKAEDLFL
ncbi:oligoendopeptidase F [Candidatus Nanohalovita haloferacivicina]|uniref:oligoendopeptidase F n=1 Tax=Candidatus Nanohalovita haloferacivicina TaxID=2978046 RepID=UPI00325FACA7|nr:Oligoendopeptidase F [Candidatus Nanohalobia archaeon BNXNv]